jgi:hypothetical protein
MGFAVGSGGLLHRLRGQDVRSAGLLLGDGFIVRHTINLTLISVIADHSFIVVNKNIYPPMPGKRGECGKMCL